MSTILITTDLGNDKELIIKEGITVAHRMQAKIELLVVVNKNLDFMPTDIGMDFADQWEARTYVAKKELQEIKNQYPDITCDMVVFVGDPKESIIERAIEIKASMIVLGTHGRTGLSHLLMGSTAEYIIRHSPIPVLVIPLNNYAH